MYYDGANWLEEKGDKVSKLVLLRHGQEIGKEMVCPLHFEKVEKDKNSKVMFDCEQVASGEMNDGRGFFVLQSANRNVITIECEGFYNHIILSEIIDRVLLESKEVEESK